MIFVHKWIMCSRENQEGEKFRVLKGRSMMVVVKMLVDRTREVDWEPTVKYQHSKVSNLDYIQ